MSIAVSLFLLRLAVSIHAPSCGKRPRSKSIGRHCIRPSGKGKPTTAKVVYRSRYHLVYIIHDTRGEQPQASYTQAPPWPLHPPLDPLLLDRRAVLARARKRQLALLELADDDLPATHHLLLVDRRHSPGEHADVGELIEDTLGLDQLGELEGLGRLDKQLQEAVDRLDAAELAIRDAVPGQLLDPLGGL